MTVNNKRRDFVKGGLVTTGAFLLGLPYIAWSQDMVMDTQKDIAIIGAGISGLSAALQACQMGKDVLVIQVQPFCGGNAKLSTGWFYACNSPVQKRLSQSPDSPEQFFEDSLAIGHGRRDPMWTKIVAENSGKDIAWLEEAGIEFEETLSAAMGSTAKRAIQVKGYGSAVIKALEKSIRQTGKADIRLGTRCQGLIVKNGDVVGIKIMTEKGESIIACKAVILASGGYSFNNELIKQYCSPEFAKMGAIGDPNQQGDGLKIALSLNAKTRNLDILNIVPTTDKETRIYLTSGALSGGGILVNEKGERFVNELKNYTSTALAMLDQKHVYEILVPECHSKVQVLINKHMIKSASSVEDLAQKINAPVAALNKELMLHNAATRGEIKDRFGRSTYKNELVAPFYYMEVMPLVLQTLGGVVVNEKTQILNEEGQPVAPNVYAVGDMVSGYLEWGYRTGDALMFGVVTGRIAGKTVS